MPETICTDCGEKKWKITSSALQEWELNHHTSSATVNSMGERLHGCRGFTELNDDGFPKILRIYNYDKLVSTKVYS